MNRQLNLKIDIDSRKVTKYNDLIKVGDTVTLSITLISKGNTVILSGENVKLLLKKEDNKKVEQSVNVSGNTITCTLSAQATTTVGQVVGELTFTGSNTKLTSSSFIFNVEGSVNNEVLEQSKDDVEILNKITDSITKVNNTVEAYKNNINAVAGTTEAVAALTEMKGLLSKAETNNTNLDVANVQAVKNYDALNQLGDATDLAKKVQNNTTQLSESVQQINNKAEKSTVQALDIKVNSLASESPKAVGTIAEMTDKTKNYVLATDGNWYYYNGSAWISGGVYQSTGIADNTVSERKTTFFNSSKNLFNKNTMTELTGQFRKYKDGTISDNVGYNGFKIPVEPNVTYSCSANPESFFNNICFFNEDTFIKGLANDTSFTTPENTTHVTIAISNKSMWFQIEKGTIPTSYEKYYNVLKDDIIPVDVIKNLIREYNGKSEIITVKKSGGDYTSIQEAINKSKPTKENPSFIIIDKGEWIEELIGKHYVHLIGVDRNKTILKSIPSVDPLTPNEVRARDGIKANFNMLIKNLTMASEHVKYCIHDDATVEAPNHDPHTLIIENCNLFKKTSYGYDIAIGAGLRSDQHIIIKNTLIRGDGGGIYVHNWNDQDSYCSLEIENSSVTGTSRCGLWLDCLGSTNTDLIILKGNKIKGGLYDLVTKNRLATENEKYHGESEMSIIASGNQVASYTRMNGSTIEFTQPVVVSTATTDAQ